MLDSIKSFLKTNKKAVVIGGVLAGVVSAAWVLIRKKGNKRGQRKR